ncbi:PAS domain S-box protein [Archangium sp.]|uniref:hybrid sensor histidine kinase/response regulator n=1 Tax=Archangium sp. TaxID=1872627 RepID=UPI00286A90FD|nr:PAS domain S-box protein [Archangium sp.]
MSPESDPSRQVTWGGAAPAVTGAASRSGAGLEPPTASLLLVDDQPANLLALEATLAPLGRRMVKAQSGAEALRCILQEDFAAILLDVQLGDLSGVEVTALIRQRERSRHVPILLLTAMEGDEREVLQGYAHGAVDFLRKPFPPEILRAKVSVFVELHLAREEVKRQGALLREKERELLERTHRERLHDLLLQAPAAIAITHGPEFVFELANSFYEKVVGRPIPLGKPLREALPEVLSQPDLMEVLHRVMRTGEPFTGREVAVSLDRRGDGTLEEAYFNLVYQPIRDADGHVSGLLTHAVEVTEHVRARREVEALAEERRQLLHRVEAQKGLLDAILRQLPAGVVVQDATGVIQQANASAEALLGLSLEQLTGRTSVDPRWRTVHEDGSPFTGEEQPAMVALRTREPQVGCVMDVHRPDGTRVWLSVNSQVFHGPDGQLAGVVSSLFDITERRRMDEALRESEYRLRVALAAADIGTWDFYPPTGPLRWDERTKALFGLPPSAEVDYDTFLAGLHPEDRERTHALVQRAFSLDSAGEFRTEYRTVGLEDGVERWVAAHGRAFFDEQGRAVRFIGTVRDITARKRAQELVRQRSEFEQQLLGIVGHDLRNPLSAILVSAELLKMRVSDERLVRPLSRITSSAERATGIIRDLLDLTQIRMGSGIPVHPKPTDLSELVRQVVEEHRASHPERDIQLSPCQEAQGVWDADRLAQVVSNLVSNALQYSPEDSPIRLEMEAAEYEARLRVHNAGPCIPEALQPHIFEPFKRGHVDTASKSLGLGLFIVERIVSAHGGTIECRSTEDEGTTFLVRLPRAPTQAP